MNKNTFLIRLTAIAVCFLAVFSCFTMPAAADDDWVQCPSSDRANAIYLYELKSGKALIHKNAEIQVSPASTVKLMTALVAYESIPDLNVTFTVTEAVVSYTDMNVMGLEVGDRMTASDLIKATVCSGYNDAAIALAICACGSVDAFVEKMNRKADELGALSTDYKDPTGLDDSARTTAKDTFAVAGAFYENKELLDISTQASFTLSYVNTGEERKIFNRNALVSGYTGTKYLNANAIGMNAGMTDAGGYCVTTAFTDGDAEYICVVMGARNDGENIYSYVIANEIINYYTRTLAGRVIIKNDEVITTMQVSGASIKNNTVDIVPNDTVTASLPADFFNDEKFNLTYVFTRNDLKAPIEKGEKVGVIIISYNNGIVEKYDMVTAEAVEKDTFISALDMIRDFLFSRFFISFAACFCVLLFAYVFILPSVNQKKKRSRYERYNRYR